MRVLLDTNIFVSYLLHKSDQEGTVLEIISGAIDGAYTLILPFEVVTELKRKVATKRYRRFRITDSEVDRLIALLQNLAQFLPPLTGSAPAVVRDPKDNFLLAAPVISNADNLVTGDNDLLVLRGALVKPAIMTPPEFLNLMSSTDPPHL